MTKIIALSGKKGSGKSTLSRFLIENSNLLFYNEPCLTIRKYAFADHFKQFCILSMGLSREQFYGTNEQKNSLTKYKWENFKKFHKGEYPDKNGFMTAREVMQVVGDDIFRSWHGDIWAEACINLIKNDNLDIAIIDDLRYPNELDFVQKAGGIVVRLHRKVKQEKEDLHNSEILLDGAEYDERFDISLRNDRMDLTETLKSLVLELEYIKFIPKVLVDSKKWKGVRW